MHTITIAALCTLLSVPIVLAQPVGGHALSARENPSQLHPHIYPRSGEAHLGVQNTPNPPPKPRLQPQQPSGQIGDFPLLPPSASPLGPRSPRAALESVTFVIKCIS